MKARKAGAAAFWIGAALLAGCTSVVAPRPQALDSLSGRLSVRVEGTQSAAPRSFSAGFELRGDARQGELSLSTPLGSVLAQALWSPQQVMLVTPQGRQVFSDLDALTRELMGEDLPVAAFFDWLRGRPFPGADSSPTRPPEEIGFLQLGWQVTLARFEEGVVVARRMQPPTVTLRAALDRP